MTFRQVICPSDLDFYKVPKNAYVYKEISKNSEMHRIKLVSNLKFILRDLISERMDIELLTRRSLARFFPSTKAFLSIVICFGSKTAKISKIAA